MADVLIAGGQPDDAAVGSGLAGEEY